MTKQELINKIKLLWTNYKRPILGFIIGAALGALGTIGIAVFFKVVF